MAAEIYARIGAEIRQRRDALGMTQAQLADRIGTGRTSVAMIERGGQALLVHQLLQLADALRATPSEILEGVSIRQDSVEDAATSSRQFKQLLRGLDTPVRRITRG